MTIGGWSAADARAGFGRRRLGLAVVLLVAFGLGSERDEAEAYRLYDNGALDYIVGSDRALRWSPEAWGPGSTLVWEIENGPDWALLSGLVDSAQDLEPFVEEALALWAAVPTADISWRLRGIEERSEESRFGDSRNSVFFDPESGIRGAAAWWIRNHSRDAWETAECDVSIPPLHDWEWVELDADWAEDWMGSFLAQELGHCLGLGSTAEFAASRRLRASSSGGDFSWRRTAPWSPTPAMKWRQPASLAPDDRVGASLLRPRAGWIETTGRLSGVLESDGEPVAYAHVWALRRSADGMRDPVGAFANAQGEFLIEGLPPGDYALWAHPIRWYRDQRPLIENGANTDLKDAVLVHPQRVAAGQVTDGIVIPMRRGRE